MKLTLVLLLVLGLTLCLAQDANNTKKAHPLVNKTDDNKTHPLPPPHHPHHPPHPRPHHKQNETNTTAPAEPEAEATNTTNTTNTTDDSAAARLLAEKRNARHHEQKDHKEHKAPGKHLRGHHEKPAEANNATNVTKPAEPEENNESEEAQVNEEESAVAEQGEDAEEAEEAARLLADKKARKNKRVAPRRGHKKGGKHGKRHHEVGENAEGVIGGEDAEDIEHELRRLLPQVHQGNNKKQVHAKRPQWKKPAHVKPELKPEDFDFFGEHHIFGEDAFENGEGFGFDWNHHNKTH